MIINIVFKMADVENLTAQLQAQAEAEAQEAGTVGLFQGKGHSSDKPAMITNIHPLIH